jgi:virginiamycin B lyase
MFADIHVEWESPKGNSDYTVSSDKPGKQSRHCHQEQQRRVCMKDLLLNGWLVLGLLVLPLAALQASDDLTVTISEWTVPWSDTRPRDPDVAPDGSIWLVGQGGHYVAHFDPETKQFERMELPPGTGPHNIIVDDDDSLWIAGNLKGWIGQMDPETGAIQQYPMPEEAAKDPHTLVFNDQGEIWFTVQWGNYVGRLDKRSGEVELVAVPTKKSRPYGIKLDSSGRPWIALLGTNALATVNPETMELTEIPLPREDARPRRIAVGSDDRVWYVDYTGGYLGVYDPASGEIKEWQSPSKENSGPYAMAMDAKDRVWFVETRVQPNQLVGFDPATESFIISAPIPSGGGAVRHMVYDEARNSLWFGTDTNNLAQARLP